MCALDVFVGGGGGGEEGRWEGVWVVK